MKFLCLKQYWFSNNKIIYTDLIIRENNRFFRILYIKRFYIEKTI